MKYEIDKWYLILVMGITAVFIFLYYELHGVLIDIPYLNICLCILFVGFIIAERLEKLIEKGTKK